MICNAEFLSIVASPGCRALGYRYYENLRSVYGRPRRFFWNVPLDALRMVGVGCEMEVEIRGLDVTQQV